MQNGTYSLASIDSEKQLKETYSWWDYEFDKPMKKKKKKKQKRKKTKKNNKISKKELRYKLIQKTADVTLETASEVILLYAKKKFNSF